MAKRAAPGFHGTLRVVLQLHGPGLRGHLGQKLGELPFANLNLAQKLIELRAVDDSQGGEWIYGRERQGFLVLVELDEGHGDLALTPLQCQCHAQVTVEQPASHPVHNHLLHPPDPVELFAQCVLLKFGVRAPILRIR